MLELVGIIVLAKAIKRIVNEKGLRAFRYVLLLVILWLGFEVIGLYVGMIIFGDVMIGYLLAFPGAALGAYISYQVAKNAQPVNSEYPIEDFGSHINDESA